MDEELILICECHSHEHQAIFRWDEDEKELTATIHLTVNDNIFKRMWTAIKYVCGHKSRYGDWDEFIFKPSDEQRLRDYLNNQKI